MKRILLLVAVASMLASAMALSGVAQAAPTIGTQADAKCLAEAAKTVKQPGFNPSNYTFIGGTEGDDFNLQGTANVPDVFCGFGGIDQQLTLEAGDIFIGGAERDVVNTNNGTFYGGAGNDRVLDNYGTFYGEEGDDLVSENFAGATFDGGAGRDVVHFNNLGSILIDVEVF
jgi:Ca2+-binding RTX toxin-like protein